MPAGRSISMRICVVFVVALAACGRHEPDGPPARRAFYFWRTTFKLSEAEQRALTELHVNRLYVRMFDVDWSDGGAQLVGKITAETPVPAGIDVVPVVFLRDEVFRHPAADLAKQVWTAVSERAAALGVAPHELQLDCDWTDKTRDAFFGFLRELKATAKLPLSATIRLHQVKYRERTGVPPVARGMLMFYNMGKFSADADARAIFDPDSAEKYLARIGEYPLPLDVALPIWSWTLHVRDDRVEHLMQSTDPDELATVPFLERSGDDRFTVTRNAFLHGTLLREGDVLKIEVTGSTETLAAAAMVAPRLARAKDRTLTLFDLSERNVTRHGMAGLDQEFDAVR